LFGVKINSPLSLKIRNVIMKDIVKQFMQPPFLICIAVLALAGAGKSASIRFLGVQLKKEPIPLKKPLDLMDESLLTPYKVIKKHHIDNKDVLENLGTEEYLQWEFENTECDRSSPVKYCSLFITYYTGNPDQVPHVPEECYVGGGNQQLASEMVTLNINSPVDTAKITQEPAEDIERKINVRYLVFVRKSSNMWQMDSKYPVMYFFKANGQYASNRTITRAIMSKNLFGKYSYFSKVEWKFYGHSNSGIVYPTKKEMVQASEKFLSVVLSVMEKEHWPDWENLDSR
jgi:hypothetical protein